MANEISLRVSLGVRKGKLQYQSNPQAFNNTMSGSARGSSPGFFAVPLEGVAADLSDITTPGYAWMQNLDDTNYVEYGIRDPITDVFYPLGELEPGEPAVVHLSRNLLEGYTDTGTGTTGPVNQLWFKANGAACNVIVHVFEK